MCVLKTIFTIFRISCYNHRCAFLSKYSKRRIANTQRPLFFFCLHDVNGGVLYILFMYHYFVHIVYHFIRTYFLYFKNYVPFPIQWRRKHCSFLFSLLFIIFILFYYNFDGSVLLCTIIIIISLLHISTYIFLYIFFFNNEWRIEELEYYFSLAVLCQIYYVLYMRLKYFFVINFVFHLW